MRCVVVGGLVLAACGGRGLQPAGEAASVASVVRIARPPDEPAATGARFTFAPTGGAAASYNDPPPPVPATPLGDAVIAATREAALQAGLAVPRADTRLFGACADLAEIVPELHPGVTLDTSAIEFALQRHGIIEPEVRVLFGWSGDDVPAHFVDQLRPKLAELLRADAAARFGVGVAQRRPDGFTAIVFALQGSSISTLPIPRAVAAGDRIAIDAVLDPRYRDPEVFVTRDDGRTHQIEVRPGRPGGFVADVACDDRIGRQQLEIAAHDDDGATVLANFPVWCGAAPPQSVIVDPVAEDAPDSPEQAERYLLDSLNRDRAAAGLPALAWDNAVAAVARSHSEEMRRTRLVTHISQTTGAATDRLRAAHLITRVVLENVARAYGVREAHQALMNSPGHRANLMSTDVTRIGVGVVFGEDSWGRRELFITEVFTWARPSRIDEPGPS